MRIANIAAWVLLGLIVAVQPASAGKAQTQAENQPEQSRPRNIQDFSPEKKRVTGKALDGTSPSGKGKTPVAVVKPPLIAEPGLIF